MLNSTWLGEEVATGESFERHGVDAVDADVAQIGDGRTIGKKVGQTGRGEGVGVVAGAMDRNRSDCNEVAVEGRGDLEVHPGKPNLGPVQLRDVVPVPRRAHGTVDQHGSPADDLARGRDDLGKDITDHRPQQIPAATDRGLTDFRTPRRRSPASRSYPTDTPPLPPNRTTPAHGVGHGRRTSPHTPHAPALPDR